MQGHYPWFGTLRAGSLKLHNGDVAQEADNLELPPWRQRNQMAMGGQGRVCSKEATWAHHTHASTNASTLQAFAFAADGCLKPNQLLADCRKCDGVLTLTFDMD